jgi:hypothetical protein
MESMAAGQSYGSGVVSYSLFDALADHLEMFCEDLEFLVKCGEVNETAALDFIERTMQAARKQNTEFLRRGRQEKSEAGGNDVMVIPDMAARTKAEAFEGHMDRLLKTVNGDREEEA